MIRARIKELRNTLKLNQTDFANRVGIKQSSLSDIENKKTETVDERTIRLVCSEFGVNETWLRDGKGEIFRSESDLLKLLGPKLDGLDEMDRKILIEYLKLNTQQRKIIKDYIIRLV